MALSQDDLLRPNWRKAKRSMSNGNCVEVALAPGTVAIRDSKDPDGPVLRYSPDSWRSFLCAARTGAYDLFR